MKPAQLEIAVKALEELQLRNSQLDRQWRMKMERADYEAQLAQRRYEEVNPSNRLVASTLEKRWNYALIALEESKKEVRRPWRVISNVIFWVFSIKIFLLYLVLSKLSHQLSAISGQLFAIPLCCGNLSWIYFRYNIPMQKKLKADGMAQYIHFFMIFGRY